MKKTVAQLQQEIGEWADSVFPDRKAINALTKMVMEEIPELISGGIDNPKELADIGILLFDVAYLQGIDLGSAMDEKMDINRERLWELNPNTGLISHVTGT